MRQSASLVRVTPLCHIHLSELGFLGLGWIFGIAEREFLVRTMICLITGFP